jgi:peptide/nickel transport system substrate-binding protein
VNFKRIVAAAAAMLGGVFVLSGCGTGSDTIEGVEGTTMTIATNAGLTSSNANAESGNSGINASIGYLTNAWFNYYDSTPKLVENTKFGTIRLIKKSPETVMYTINAGVKWSDGTPVSAADLLLDWAASIDMNNNGTSSIAVNDHREFLNFHSARAFGDINDAGMASVSNDERSMTLVYDNPNPDWQTALPANPVAAHAVYEMAYPGTKPAAANTAVIEAIEHRNIPELIKIANAWKTAFAFPDTPSNKLLDLSDGAYVISSAVEGKSLVLSSNKSYNWGPLPTISRFRFRVIRDPVDQLRALKRGEVNLIYGDGDTDPVAAPKGSSGITTSASSSGYWDHVDLTEDSGGPFDAASYGGDASKALLVRQAFMKALPRQAMLDKLIRPTQPDAKLDDSLTFLPGSAGYDASVADNGSAAYATVDIAAARADLKSAGVSKVDVRVLYPKHNTRNAEEFALMQKSEKKAGFNLIDDSSDDWSTILGNQSYDTALFAWQNTTLDVMAGVSHLAFLPNNTSVFNAFRNPTVDSDSNELSSELDPSAELKLMANIDKEGWADASSVPLFQSPDVVASSSNIHNVKDSPVPPGIFWNFWDWTVDSVHNQASTVN